jgi:flagellar P-ring protein FlgI
MKLILLCSLLLFSTQAFSKASRIKDLVTVKGVRENPIIGYGLVIGLNGSGDGGGEITNTSLKRMFQKLGLNPKSEISSKNVAAVIVTAKMKPFTRIGQKLDVTVSSIGDASSLAGGTLLVTPLKAGDGNIYAITSGSLSIGGLNQGKKFATTAMIPGGATIEKEVDLDFDKKSSLRLSLKNSDFTTAARIEKTINQELGGKYAAARDSTTIDLVIPAHYKRKVVQLMAIVENFTITSDTRAVIVINERTGTIVAGGHIVLRPVAISHGNLTIEVKGDGAAAAKKNGQAFYYMKKQTTLNELVKSLNAFGATPEDLISIFQTLKTSGALIGDIELI